MTGSFVCDRVGDELVSLALVSDEIAAGALRDQFPVDVIPGGAGTSTRG